MLPTPTPTTPVAICSGVAPQPASSSIRTSARVIRDTLRPIGKPSVCTVCDAQGPPLWSGRPRPDERLRVVDIFDEVDEELRAERAQKLLKQYGGYIVAAALLVVGAAAGWQAWRWHEARVDAAAAAQYLTAMNLADATVTGSGAANRAAADGAFDKVVADAPDGYRAIARLRAAALQADAGDLP